MRFLTLFICFLCASSLAACVAESTEPTLIARDDGSVVLSNYSAVAITYRGYSPDSPLYGIESELDGAWQASPIGWCGTGLSEQRLEPGAQVIFTVGAMQDGRPRRVVLTIGSGATTQQLVSNPVKNKRELHCSP